MKTAPLHKPEWVDAMTPIERALFRVPILRTLLRWPLRGQREMRVERAVKQQMLTRDAFDAEAWGNDPERVRVAQRVGARFARVLGLPNAHVLPDDPLEVLVFDADPLVGIEIRLDIEEALGRAFADECFAGATTIGVLVDRLTAAQASASTIS